MLNHAIKPQPVMISRHCAGRVLAWSALLTTMLVLAVLFQTLVASALVAPGPAALSTACQAALTVGNNARESFLAHLCAEPATSGTAH
jgi:hypothetical protein